jgi:hypothetical protein
VRREHAVKGLLWLRVESENRTQLCVTGQHQSKTILLRRFKGFFVGANRSVCKILELRQGKKAAADFFAFRFN